MMPPMRTLRHSAAHMIIVITIVSSYAPLGASVYPYRRTI